uniref:Cyclic nucleotide-binding domain-containing protein n=1 Tax=Palpitomonas bilix TaxID=652834 RepID=A0A7S3DEE5_9EUKA
MDSRVLHTLSKFSASNMRATWMVTMEGEEAIDCGGVSRELMDLAMKALFGSYVWKNPREEGDVDMDENEGGEGGGEGGKSGRQVSFLAVSKPGEEEKDDAEEVREKKTNDLPAGLLVQNVPEPTPGERSRKLIRRLSMRVTESPLLRRGSSSGASTPEMGSPRDGSPSRRTQDSASPRKSMLQRFHLHAGDDDNDNDSERVKREELRAHFEKVEAERRERERIAKEAEEKRVEDIKDSYRQAENADILLKARLEEIEKSDLLPHEKEEAAAEQIDCRAIVDPEVQAPLLFTNIEEGIGSHNYSRILDRHFELALMKSPLLRSERDIKVINRWLSNSDFLSHHSLPVRQEICSRMRVVRSRGGDFLFHAGDKANDFYYILSGAVTVERASTTSDAVVVLKTLVKGNAFGFASLYSNNYCPNDEELEKIVAMQNPKNKGKGDAMKEGFARVRTVSKVKLLTKKLLAVARAPRRNATVRIYEDSVLLAVSHDDYVASLAKYDLSQVYRQDIYAKLRALRGFTIFLSWGHDELVKLASSIRIHHLKMDRIALDVGEKPKSLYFVKSGTCYMLYPRQVAGADGGERPLSPFSKRRKSSMLGRPGTAGGGTSERKRSESMRGGRGKGEEETKEDRARVLARFHQPSKELFQAINQNKAFQTLKKEAQKTEAADKEEKPLLPPGADTPVPSPTPSGRASKMSGRTSGMSTTSTSLPTPEALLEEEGYRKDDDDGSNFEEIMTLQAGSVFGIDPYFYHLSQSSQTKGATREVGLVEDSDEEGGREGEKRRRKKKGGGGGGGGIGTMSKREKEERADAILLEKAESSMQKPSPVRIKTDTHVELLELPLAELWRLGEKTSVEVHERHPLVVMDLRRHLGQRAQWDKQKREIVTSCLRPHSKTVLAKKRENGEKGI